VRPKPLPHRPLVVTLPVEDALVDDEVRVNDEHVVIVMSLAEETRVESVLALPTDVDVR
jgi:hypothetical protein